jgi:hypothetical protein
MLNRASQKFSKSQDFFQKKMDVILQIEKLKTEKPFAIG